MKYFEVMVEIRLETDDSKGGVKIKKIRETYLVDALTVTEAEARVVKLFVSSGYSQDYEVTGVKGSKIVEVVSAETKLKSLNNTKELPQEKDEE